MRRSLPTNEIIKTEIGDKSIFDLFSKMWKIAERMEERAKPCSISISILKKDKKMILHILHLSVY